MPKKGFMSYMSKVYQHEMRDAVKVSDESFKIKNNQSQTEQEVTHQEKYLSKIESSLEVFPEWHFKKRLASVLPRTQAYNLLKSFNNLKIELGEVCRIILNQFIVFPNGTLY